MVLTSPGWSARLALVVCVLSHAAVIVASDDPAASTLAVSATVPPGTDNPIATSGAADNAGGSVSINGVATALDLGRISFTQWSQASPRDIGGIAASAFSAPTLYEAAVISRALRNISLSCGVLNDCCSGFTGDQLRAMSFEAFTGFTSLCVKQLSVDAIQSLTPAKLNALPAVGVASWTTAQVNAISPDAFTALSPRQAVDFTSNAERRARFCAGFSPAAASKVSNMMVLLYLVHSCGEAFNAEAQRVALGRICTLCEYAFVVTECHAVELTADAKSKLNEACRDKAPKFSTEAEALAIVSAAAQQAKAARSHAPSVGGGAVQPPPPPAVPAAGGVPQPGAAWQPAPTWHGSAMRPTTASGSHVNALFGGGGSIAVLLVVLTGMLAYAGYVQRMRNRQQFTSPTSSEGPTWTPIGGRRSGKHKKGTRGGGPENIGLASHPGGYGSLQEPAEI